MWQAVTSPKGPRVGHGSAKGPKLIALGRGSAAGRPAKTKEPAQKNGKPRFVAMVRFVRTCTVCMLCAKLEAGKIEGRRLDFKVRFQGVGWDSAPKSVRIRALPKQISPTARSEKNKTPICIITASPIDRFGHRLTMRCQLWFLTVCPLEGRSYYGRDCRMSN